MYGISQADYDNMWAAQEGRCASCDDPLPEGKNTHVDHDHRYGNNWWAVRGLLCRDCNQGNFHDDPTRVRAFAAYLEAA